MGIISVNKKRFFSYMAVVCGALLWSIGAMAQTQTIEIGTGTSTNYYPIPGFWGWQYDVYLYTPNDATELNDDCTVTGIAYNHSSTSTTTGAQWTIYMKDVDANYSLAAGTTFATYIAGATQVYSGSTFPTSTGWYTLNMANSFQHQAGRAILVCVYGRGCTTSGGCSRNCYYTSATNAHWYKHQDSSDPGTSTTGSLDSNRSNIRLTVDQSCTQPTFSVSPTTGTTFIGESVNISLTNPNGTNVTWQSSDTGVATVVGNNTGAIVTGVGRGTATITASIPASGDFCSKRVTYTVTVNKNCYQTINMATITRELECGRNYCFYDSGGENGSYINNEDYTATFTSAGNITISFESFASESSFDKIYVYDGTTAGIVLINAFSGTSLPATVTATSGTMTVYWHSDGSNTNTGWSANLTATGCCTPRTGNFAFATTTVETFLGETINSPALTNSVTPTGTVTYSSSDETIASVNATTGVVTAHGIVGTVTITATIPATGDFCASRATYTLNVRKNCYQTINMANLTREIECGKTYCFYDSGGENGTYTASEDYTATFTSSGSITIDFESFNSESCCDYISIYDGTTAGTVLVSQHKGSELPPTVTASSGTMTVVWHTDGSVQYDGWSANITAAGCCTQRTGTFAFASNTVNGTFGQTLNSPALTNTVTPTGTVTYSSSDPMLASVDPTTGAVTINGVVGTAVITASIPAVGDFCASTASYTINVQKHCDQTVNMANMTREIECGLVYCFYDSGGANGSYGNSEDYTATFTSSGNITISFESFNTESCCDYISVYDGSTTGTVLINQHKGSELPATVTATSGTMTVVWHTDGSVIYDGWSACVYSTGCCTQRPGVFAFATNTVNATMGQTFDSPALTNTVTPTGTVTYSSSDPTLASVDPATGEVTINGVVGTVTITATIPAVGDLCASRSSYTINIQRNCYQTITMANITREIECGKVYCFYDTGGENGSYGNSENYTATFTSSGNITISFESFASESIDKLTIYDGTTTGTVLLNAHNGTTTPASVTATSGTMTVVWYSDGSVVYDGWVADITAVGCCTSRTGTFSFANSVYNVIAGESVTQTVTNNLTPRDGAITYTSSDTNLATVTQNGVVSTVAGTEGIVTITATIAATGDFCAMTASYNINVGDGCALVGNGTETIGTAPIYGFYKNSWDEIIYTSAEVGGSGVINSIGFYSTQANTIQRTVEIYMALTDKESFESSTDFVSSNEMTLVYTGTWDITTGWQMFNLNQPFNYGICGKNLIIGIKSTASSYSSTTFSGTISAGNQTIYSNSDTYVPDPTDMSGYQGSTGLTTTKPNAKICITPCDCPVFEFSDNEVTCYMGVDGCAIPTLISSSDENATYSSSNTDVAVVDPTTGEVTTIGLGTATITASVVAGTYCAAIASYVINVERCTPNLSSADGSHYIANFTATGGTLDINNTTVGEGGSYNDYYASRNFVTNLNAATTVNFSILVAGGATYGASIWVDYNQDGMFSTTERVFTTTSAQASPIVGQFTVPAYAQQNEFRMRVVVDRDDVSPSNPCEANTGEFEDYKIITPEEVCTPTITSGNTYFYISNVTTSGGSANINNSSTGTVNSYSNYYTTSSVTALVGSRITTTVTLSSTYSSGLAIWVDWNRDGIFDDSERVYRSNATATSPLTASFRVPSNAQAGDYRMRILAAYSTASPSDPCVSTVNGEYEDYKIIVTQPTLTFTDGNCSGTYTNVTPDHVSGYGYVPIPSEIPQCSDEDVSFVAWNTEPDGSGTSYRPGSAFFLVGNDILYAIFYSPCCNPDSAVVVSSHGGGDEVSVAREMDGFFYYNVCLGEQLNVRFDPRDGCSYTNARWILSTSDGNIIRTVNGMTFSHTFDVENGYNLSFSANSTAGCKLDLYGRVRVSRGIHLSHVSDEPIATCPENIQPITIGYSGEGSHVEIDKPGVRIESTLGKGETIFLPDGVDCDIDGDGLTECAYVSSVEFTGFSDDGVVRSVDDILYLRMNLEHSYIGDIYIALTCPNGTTVPILRKNASGSNSDCASSIPSAYYSWIGTGSTSAYFGEAYEPSGESGVADKCDSSNANLAPGVGWNYAWSENTSRGYVYAGGTYGYVYETANIGHDMSNVVDSSRMDTFVQFYHPEGSFSDLIGCPLNGEWSIVVLDGWNIDNGYIFEWELALSEDLLPESWGYDVELDTAWADCNWITTGAKFSDFTVTPPEGFTGGPVDCVLTYIDEYGCQTSDDITLDFNINIIDLRANVTPSTCGRANGVIELIPNGATQPCQYRLDGGQLQSNNRFTVAAGTYTVSVVDANGCMDEIEVTVVDNTDLAISGLNDIEACGGATITLTPTVSGGVGNYTYLWTPGNVNTLQLTANPDSDVDYIFQVTDGDDCSMQQTVHVTIGQLLDITVSDDVVMCSGSTATIGVTVPGNASDFTYVWSNNSTSASFDVSPTSTTTYTVTVIDATNTSCTVSDDVVVTINNPSVVLNTIGNQTICQGDDATLSVTAASSNGDLTYAWSSASANAGLPTTLTTSSISVTPTATSTYNVTVTATAGTCTATASSSVTVTVNSPSVALNAIADQTICEGDAATLAVTASNSNGDLTYVWSSADANAGMPTALTTSSISVTPTSTSTYNVTVTAIVGTCTATASRSVTVTVNSPSVALNTIADQTICEGGAATLSVTAANNNGDLTYVWSSADANAGMPTTLTTSSISVTPTSTSTYNVTVTATVGTCTATASRSVTVTVNSPSVSLNTIADQTICEGEVATLSVTAANNNGDLTYVWSSADANAGMPTTLTTSSISVTPTSTSTYNVTVTATVGTCTATASRSVTVTVNSPSVTLNTITNQTICLGEDATLSVTASNNNGDLTYVWSSADANAGMPTTLTTSSISVTPTSTSTYNVTVTATVGTCTATASRSVTVTVNSPSVTLNTITNQTICLGEDATLSVTASNNNGDLTYVWSSADANAGLPTTLTTSSINVTPTSASTYNVTVTATVGTCTATASSSVAITVNNPIVAINNNTGTTMLTCALTEISVTAEIVSGTGQFTWSNGLGNNATQDITSPGTYFVTLTDANGCEGTESITIEQSNENPIVTLVSSDITICAGNFTTVEIQNVAGGTGIYEYSWNGGVSYGNETSYTTATLDSDATVSVIVRDSNGCRGNASAVINVDARPTAVVSGNETICNGSESTFAITFTGEAPYSYTWSDGTNTTDAISNTNSVTITVTPTSTTTYTVTALSDNNCTAIATDITGSAVVSVDERPTAVVSGNETICNGGESTFAISFTGEAPYSYTWSDGTNTTDATSSTNSVTITVTPTVSTTYTVTMLSDNNCTAIASDITGSAVVSVDERPTAVVSGNETICNGGESTFVINFTGEAPYSYTWSDGTNATDATSSTNSVTITVTPTVSTTYTVTALSDNNCTAIASDITGSAVVSVDERPTAVVSGIETICNGDESTFAITFTGEAPYSYTWSDGTNTTDATSSTNSVAITVTPTSTTTYTVTMLSDNNCTAIASDITGSAVVSVDERPTAVVSGGDVVCADYTGALQFTIEFTGNAPYDYTWTDGTNTTDATSSTNSVTITVTPTATTTYTVTALSDANCTAIATDITGSAVITVNPLPEVSIVNNTGATTLTCDITEISLTADAVVGSGNFTWSGTLGANANQTISAPGSYSVTITDANGCSDNASITIDQSNENPVVTLLDDAITICSGETATVTIGNVSGGSGTYQYSWNNGAYAGNTEYTTASLTDAVTVAVVARDENGCTGSAEAIITINTPEVGTIAIADSTICNGNEATLTAMVAGNMGDLSFAWSDGLGDNATTAAITAGGTYVVTVTATNVVNGVSCFDVDTQTGSVVVNDRPTAMISGDYVVCADYTDNQNVSIVLTGATPYVVVWNDGVADHDSTTSESTIIIPVHPAATTTYTLVSMSDNNGCNSANGDLNGTATITVNDLPEPSVIGDHTSCDADVILTALPTSLEYNWGGGYISENTYTATATGTYTVTVKNANECTASADFDFTRYSLVEVEIAAVGTLCPAETGAMDVTATITTATVGEYIYTWSGSAELNIQNATQTTSETTSTIGITVPSGCNNTYALALNVVDGHGCPVDAAGISIVVEDTEAPVISGTLGDINVDGCSAASAPAAATTVAELIALGLNAITDNCNGLVVTSADVENGTCPIEITRTYTVADSCGNTASVDQIINVNVVAMTIPDNRVDGVVCEVDAVQVMPNALPNYCGDLVAPAFVERNSTVDASGVGAVTYHYTYSDCLGTYDWYHIYNVAPDGFVAPANVVENVACVAEIHLPAEYVPHVVVCQSDVAVTLASEEDNVVNGCGDYVYTYAYVVNGVDYTWTYTYVVAPQDFTLPADGAISVACVDEALVTEITLPYVETSCGEIVPTLTSTVDNPTTITCQGTRTFTYTYANCAYSHDWNYVYTINDTIEPVFETIVPFEANCSEANIEDAIDLWLNSVVATDNCVTPNVVNDYDATMLPTTGCGEVTVTFTASDCQNTVTASSTITIKDEEKPNIGDDVLDEVLVGVNCVYTVPDFRETIRNISSDACTSNADLVITQIPEQNTIITTSGTIVVSVTVTDLCGNDSTRTVNLFVPTEPITATISGDATVCAGNTIEHDVTIAMTGDAPYTVEWTDGNAVFDSITNESSIVLHVNPSQTTTYSILSMTDNNGCQPNDLSSTAVFTVNTRPTAHISGGQSVCADNTDMIDLTIAFTGEAPYSYSWTDGTNTTNGTATESTVTLQVNPTVSTTYTLVALEDANCESIASDLTGESVVVVNSLPIVSLTTPADICYGTSTVVSVGQITEALAPYQYSWNGGAYSTVDTYATGILVASENVTLNVRDANGCVGTDQTTVAVKPLPDASAENVTICAGETATMTALPAGAEYAWSDGLGSTDVVSVVPATTTTYTVTVTLNGCSNTASPIVYVNSNPTVSISAPITEIDCNNPTVSVVASGSTATYEWSNGTAGALATFADAGEYSVVASTENGCMASASVVITENSIAPVATITNNTGTTTLNCEVLSISVVADGGISYEWSNDVAVAGNAFDMPGTYVVTVTAENGCQSTADITISRPETLTISVTYDEISCHDGTTTVFVSANGGTPAYTGTGAFTNTAAGQYTYMVSDQGGCSATQTINIANPDEIAVTVTSDPILCYGESTTVTITAEGGTPEYLGVGTRIENAGTYYYTVTDHNGCSSTVAHTITQPDNLNAVPSVLDAQCFGETGSASLMVAGGTAPYVVTWLDGSTGLTNNNVTPNMPFTYSVVDANGCILAGNVTASQPTALQMTFEGTDVTCSDLEDGTITVTVTGGTPPYFGYYWSDEGYGYYTHTGLNAGNYTFTVSDSHECTLAGSYRITKPQPLLINLSGNDIVCGNMLGSITANVSGGTPEYNYSWSNFQTGVQSIDMLQTGEYSLSVTDANGCSATASRRVSLTGGIDVYASVSSPIICNGDNNAIVEAVSHTGAMPIIYSWNNGNNGPNAYNLGAGTYYVTAMDAWGCSGYSQVTVNEPTRINVSAYAVDAKCYDTNDGSIHVSVNGGSAPYEYLWSVPELSGYNPTNISAGTYGLTITDVNGCEMYQTITVGRPEEIEILADVTDISCYGKRDGVIEVSANGGVSPYEFTLVNNQNSYLSRTRYTRLPEGRYVLSAVDRNGCTSSMDLYIGEPSKLTAEIEAISPSCEGNNDGMIRIDAIGGTEPYMYGWSNYFSDVPLLTGLRADDYTIMVTDAHNCSYEATVALADSRVDCLRIPNVFTPNGDGVNDQWIIENMDMFPDAHIYVFNRWGQMLFQARGSDEPWDGTYHGHYVPAGVYIYIIDIHTDHEVYEGTVSILY